MGIICFVIILIVVFWLGWKSAAPNYNYPYSNDDDRYNNYDGFTFKRTQKIKTFVLDKKNVTVTPIVLPEVKPEINCKNLPMEKVENELPVNKS